MNTRQTTENANTQPKAVVLLSGGLDSYTTAAIAASQGYQCYGLTILYGQRHQCEIKAAQKIAQSLNLADHKMMNLDLRAFGGSALTDSIDVPKDGSSESTIPVTYVPARNTIFLSLALAWAEVLGAYDIFIGANAVDYSGYPDCRPAFLEAYQTLANLATKAGVEGTNQFTIHAPIVSLTKDQIISKGLELGLDYSLSHSCYDPDPQGRACGQCDSCRIRLKGFDLAGSSDPVEYIKK